MNEVNQIGVSLCDDEFEVKEAHVRNPNNKGKNYDPNYQNRNKNNNNNNSSNSSSNTVSEYNKHYNSNGGDSSNTKSLTSRISQPMCKLLSLNQSTGTSCLRSRKLSDIHHNTEISYHQMSDQQQVSMLNHLINFILKRLKSIRQP